MSGPVARSADYSELVDLALQVLPDLQAARDRLAEDPDDVVRRLPTRPQRAPADELRRVLENGGAAVEALEAEGAEVSLDSPAKEGLEAIVFQVARPALFM